MDCDHSFGKVPPPPLIWLQIIQENLLFAKILVNRSRNFPRSFRGKPVRGGARVLLEVFPEKRKTPETLADSGVSVELAGIEPATS